MKRFKIVLLCLAAIICVSACGKKETSDNVQGTENQETMETETQMQFQTTSAVNMGKVKSVWYSGENDIFVGYGENAYFFFNDSGKIIKKFKDDILLETSGNKNYLCNGIGNYIKDNQLYVIDDKGSDITSKYVSSGDRLCSVAIMDNEPVIIAVVNKNTVNTGDSSLVIYNKDKSVKFSVNVSQIAESGLNYNFFQKMKVRNLGEGMLLLSNSSEKYILNTQTSEAFMIVQNESNSVVSDYHNGYASYRIGNSAGLINKDGKVIIDENSLHPLDCTYSHGVYFNFADKKFYDKSGNTVIDLSEYNVVIPRTNNATNETMLNLYVFDEAGYCTIKVKNPAGVEYQGVIDINGRWVVELSEEVADYLGKIDEQTLLVRRAKTSSDNMTAMWSEAIDIKTGNKIYDNSVTDICEINQFYQNKYYLTEDGIAKVVDLKTGEKKAIEFYEGDANNSTSNSATENKNVNTWFNNENLQITAQGDFVLNTDNHEGTVVAFPCSAVVTSINNGDGTINETFEFTLNTEKNRKYRFSAAAVDRYTGKLIQTNEESEMNLDVNGKQYKITQKSDFSRVGMTVVLKYDITYPEEYDGLLYYIGYADEDIAERTKEKDKQRTYMSETAYWGTEGYWFSLNSR